MIRDFELYQLSPKEVSELTMAEALERDKEHRYLGSKRIYKFDLKRLPLDSLIEKHINNYIAYEHMYQRGLKRDSELNRLIGIEKERDIAVLEKQKAELELELAKIKHREYQINIELEFNKKQLDEKRA